MQPCAGRSFLDQPINLTAFMHPVSLQPTALVRFPARTSSGLQRTTTGLRAQGTADGFDSPTETATSNSEKKLRGIFSIADPDQEVYSKAGETFEPRQRPGRYKSDFIWNQNWQETLKRKEDLERKMEQYKQSAPEAPHHSLGTVNFSQRMMLDDLSVDLSKQLQGRPQVSKPPSPTSAPLLRQPNKMMTPSGVPVFSRTDLRKLERSNKAIRRASVPVVPVAIVTDPDSVAQLAAENKQYDALKLDFLVWTSALGTLGSVTAYLLYTTDVAASYTVGALAGFLYLRLLSRSVDAVGASGLGETVGGSLGQPRLLIPVILALSFNRWNQLYANQVGVHLELLPQLLGFFTYKFAMLGRQGLELLTQKTGPVQKDKDA